MQEEHRGRLLMRTSGVRNAQQLLFRRDGAAAWIIAAAGLSGTATTTTAAATTTTGAAIAIATPKTKKGSTSSIDVGSDTGTTRALSHLP